MLQLRLAVLSSRQRRAPSPCRRRPLRSPLSALWRGFGEFQVRGAFEKSLSISVVVLRGRAAVDARVTFINPFTEITGGAAPDQPRSRSAAFA